MDEEFAYIYANDLALGNETIEKIKKCYELSNEVVEKEKSILGIIS